MRKRVALLCNETRSKNFFELLDIYKDKQFRKPPKNCVSCNSTDIVSLEILGIDKEVIFWECEVCGKKHMKYSKSYTYKLLNTLKDCYINPDDFIDIQGKEIN